jgi:type VI secretion system secreted protein Hcp
MSREEASHIARAAERVRRSSRALKIAIPTAAALGAGAAVAVGSIPGGNGTITGCYAGPNGVVIDDAQEAPGALRVIDPSLPANPLGAQDAARECERDETQITWNQNGPPGPQGPTGPQGAQGAAGGQGAAGAAGTSQVGGTSFGLKNNSGLTFLKLDGISGESTDKSHKGDIDIESFAIGSEAAVNPGPVGSGAGAGKVTLQSFTITKKLDKSSPSLFQAAATGKHFPNATLLFARRVGGKEQDYLQLKIDNAVISKLQQGAAAGSVPQEEISFTYQKLEETLLSNGRPKLNLDITANSAL